MSSIRLFFCGDFCSKSSTRPINVSEDLKRKITSCELKVCNFEVPLKPDGGYFPPQERERFYQHDDVPEFLKGLGFNLFSIATNHTFDWDDAGFLKTKEKLGDEAFGAGNYENAYKVKTVDVEGVKIGFLAVCFAAYKGVFDDVTNHDGLSCAYINDHKVNHVIIEAKKEVDYLIILPHDGIEYIDIPLPETMARYRDFIDYGADAVIGTHPHCPQGWEEYKGKPIFYSLGNFLFNSKDGYSYRAWNRPHWYEGLCVILIIEIPTHRISYEVINTKNVDNMGIVIDEAIIRCAHNNQLCNYLIDDEAYKRCFQQQMCTIVLDKYLPRFDTTFHEFTFKLTIKAAIHYAWNKIRGKNNGSDLWMQWFLKHDIQRASLLRVMKNNRLGHD